MSSSTTALRLADTALAPHLRQVRRLTLVAAVVVALWVIPSFAWLALAPLTSAVVGSGFVKVDLDRRPVQHAEGGIVAEVKVRDGQFVRRGDPLIVLGDVSVAADTNRLSFLARGDQAVIARLEAEQSQAPAMSPPRDLLDSARSDSRVADALNKERALFTVRRDALNAQVKLLRDQQARVRQEIVGLRAQIVGAERSLGHQSSELETNRRLLRDGFISSTRISQLEASVADYSVKLSERRSELARAEQKIIDAELRIRSLNDQYRYQASGQLATTLQHLSELQQELRKMTDAAARQVIVSPADGDVLNLKVTTPGSVIAPRDTIADIVPATSLLLVEARIRPEDIRQVRYGQPVDIRFTAFNPRTTPAVEGRVVYVSADRLVDRATMQAYYVVHVEADPDSLQRAGNLALKAGMPAEVFVKGETRTPLEYLIEPIKDVLRHSAREI